jgi:uncharacterized protein YecA (UPF0149 family)
MNNYEEILKNLDIIMEDLTPEQLEGLKKMAETIGNPNNMSVQQAMKLVKDLDLDIEKLQKNARKKRAEEREKTKKPKIGVNEKCPCESGKKYKKCCMFAQNTVQV